MTWYRKHLKQQMHIVLQTLPALKNNYKHGYKKEVLRDEVTWEPNSRVVTRYINPFSNLMMVFRMKLLQEKTRFNHTM